jgi:hypothetical protein
MKTSLELPATAMFRSSGPWLEYEGQQVCVQTMPILLEEGFCTVLCTDHNLWSAINCVAHPKNPQLKVCTDFRLVELAARYWVWAYTRHNYPWPDTPVPVLESIPESRTAWIQHIREIHWHMEEWEQRQK